MSKLWPFGKKRRCTEKYLDQAPLRDRDACLAKEKLVKNLEENIQKIEEYGGKSMDVKVRKFYLGSVPGALVFTEGLSGDDAIEEILRTLFQESRKTNLHKVGRGKALNILEDHLLPVAVVERITSFLSLYKRLLAGDSLLLLQGYEEGLICDTRRFQMRNIDEPEGETNLRGARDGFVESLRINVSLIRRRLPTPHLWVESMEIGALSHTTVALLYIKGLAREDLIGEVRGRLEKIHVDGVLESGVLEDFISDNPFSPFPLIFRTERPDVVTASLLEGRVALITDTTPFVLVMPMALEAMLQAPDDYYENVYIGSFLRILRMLTFLISILLPGIYVAVVNFHHTLMPSSLFLRIISIRHGLPFPVLAEVLFLQLIFEVLREAGLRLPRAIGSAISIVGALILGEAAVQAGLVSPSVVIIIAGTAIASFTVPFFTLGIAARLLIFFFIFMGGTFGLFGIQIGILLILIHLTSLRSFGQPYLYPLAPFVLKGMQDGVLRVWWWALNRRPQTTGVRDPHRQEKRP